MSRAKVVNGVAVQYPYSLAQLRADWNTPDGDGATTSFNNDPGEDELIPFGSFPVTFNPPNVTADRQVADLKDVEHWTVGDDTVTATYLVRSFTIAERKAMLTNEVKQKRWEVEIAGVVAPINGQPVQVSTARGDERNQLHMEFTRLMSGLRTDPSTFNFADGKPRSVSNADMQLAIGIALAHVQAAFDRENTITAAINSASQHAPLDAALALIREPWT